MSVFSLLCWIGVLFFILQPYIVSDFIIIEVWLLILSLGKILFNLLFELSHISELLVISWPKCLWVFIRYDSMLWFQTIRTCYTISMTGCCIKILFNVCSYYTLRIEIMYCLLSHRHFLLVDNCSLWSAFNFLMIFGLFFCIERFSIIKILFTNLETWDSAYIFYSSAI